MAVMERMIKFINKDISTSMLYAYISFSLSEELSLSPIPSDNDAEILLIIFQQALRCFRLINK